jgi:hypothetical protein
MHRGFAAYQSGFAVSQSGFAALQSGFAVSWKRFALLHIAVQVMLERFGASPERPADLSNRLGPSRRGREVVQRRPPVVRRPFAFAAPRGDEDFSWPPAAAGLG